MNQANGYYITEQIGAGGFGEVWKAIRLKDGLLVAIKFLKTINTDTWQRFFREATILSERANHIHVVRLLDANFNVNHPYLVMEYCDGGSLASWVKQDRGWVDIVTALAQAAVGLQSLHAVDGFHRDIKPDNLLIKTDNGRLLIKLADFGLARSPEPAQPMSTTVAGTPGYMAPELTITGMTKACDIYSFGVTTLELLTGTRDRDELKRKQFPVRLTSITDRMLNASPSARPTIDEVVTEFNKIIQEEEFRAKFKTLVTTSAKTSPVRTTAPTNALAPLLLLGLGALAVAALLSDE